MKTKFTILLALCLLAHCYLRGQTATPPAATINVTWNVKKDTSVTIVIPGVYKIVLTNFDSGKKVLDGDKKVTITSNSFDVTIDAQKKILYSGGQLKSFSGDISFAYTGSSKQLTLKAVIIQEEPAPGRPEKTKDGILAGRFPYYDAHVLRFNKALRDSILAKYGGGSNRFLPKGGAEGEFQSATDAKFVNNAISSLGGLDVTKFADGLAKFLVKRAKEELTIAFFEDFKKELDEHEDIKDLFPNTRATLDLVGEEIYNYERYLVTLRENFETDFEALPDNITKIVENHAVYFAAHKELASGIFVGSKIAIGLRDKDHPGEIISSLEKTDMDGFKPKIVQSFLVVQTFSEALRDSSTGEKANYWISKKQFQQMAKDDLWLKYFIGLSLEMMKEKDTTLYNSLITKTSSGPFRHTLDSMITQTSRINTLIATHRDDPKVTLETITGYVDATTDLLATVDNAIQLIKPALDEREFLKNKFIPLVKSSNNLVANISKEKYSSALVNVIELYKMTVVDTPPTSDQQVVLTWLTKYGGFMAAMMSAENSDEVAAVIETYALPSGSARIKRQSYFNIAVNSYLGLSMGWDKAHRWAPGVSAPVGVAFSWGTKKGGSFSIFPTLIDIGAVTAFRFKDDTSQVAKIYLREIFSPGLFFSFGIRKLPISLNFGGQFAPLLQRVVAGSNDYNIQRNFRLSASFLVDIPLLNLYNRANKKPVVAKVPKAPKKANANKL